MASTEKPDLEDLDIVLARLEHVYQGTRRLAREADEQKLRILVRLQRADRLLHDLHRGKRHD